MCGVERNSKQRAKEERERSLVRMKEYMQEEERE